MTHAPASLAKTRAHLGGIMSDKKIIEPAPDVGLRLSVIEQCLIQQDERLTILGLQLAAAAPAVAG